MGNTALYKAYDRENSHGYEGTYEFLNYEPLDCVDKPCVPKIKVFEVLGDNWGRTYKEY